MTLNCHIVKCHISSRNDQDNLDTLLAGEVDYMLVAELVALGDHVGQRPPGAVYDFFGKEPETPAERQRIFVAGSIYEGWAAGPDRYKGPSGPMDPTFKHGTTLFTLQF